LIGGIARAVAALRPDLRIVGVEPTGAAKLAAALGAGRPVRLERTSSLADGLLPLAVGQLPFAQLAGVVREAEAVTEEELAGAVRFLYREAGLRVEPSGAATTAALLAGRIRPTGPTAAVVSGGNVDPGVFESLVR
jgi:threonine dehydratase